jgi:membrane protein implicated in regulation of membrane protease activity
MKVFALLAAIFFKWNVLGVPLWVSVSMLVPVALALAYWHRRLKKRSEAQPAGELADSADTHGDSSEGANDPL